MPGEPVAFRRRYDDCRGASNNRTADPSVLRSALVVALIYFFLVGVSSLETGIKIMGADTQERLFSTVSNPLAGLFIGILGTILVQSSSASTSVIVGLVATRALKIDDAAPMIMGANIGTTVTNTLVSLAHIRQSEEFKRAFSVATVHDFFNVIAVAILLPIELATGVLSSITESISRQLLGNAGMVAMLLGVIITIAVQSSSITTSVLIPMSAAGVLSLRNAFPVTLGANVGTIITALLAALATDAPEALTIALGTQSSMLSAFS